MELADAVKLAEQDMVDKRNDFQLRYAIRFKSLDNARKKATDHGILDFSAFRRFKLTGIHAIAGIRGVAALLADFKRNDV